MKQHIFRLDVFFFCEGRCLAFVDCSDVEIQTLHNLTAAIQKHFVGAILLVLHQIVEVALSPDLL